MTSEQEQESKLSVVVENLDQKAVMDQVMTSNSNVSDGSEQPQQPASSSPRSSMVLEEDPCTKPDNLSETRIKERSLLSPSLVSYYEEMNPSRRSSMEDTCVYHPPSTWDAPDPDMAFLGVYDGHGGRDMVEYLHEALSFHVAQELSHNDGDDLPTKLERAFLIADIHSKTVGVQLSGATVAMCLIQNHPNTNRITLYCANAGDARVVLGHEGTATRLTRDHRPEDPQERERIEQSGGFFFKNRVLGVLAVTRSLGDHCLKKFVVSKPFVNQLSFRLPQRDPASESKENDNDNTNPPVPSFIIVACDGLWDVFSDQDAVNFVLRFSDERDHVAKHLTNEALRRGSSDNVTVQVAWL